MRYPSLRLVLGLGVTPEQMRAWQALRIRYRENQDLFTSREQAHLRFLRWLVRTGRLGA